MFLHVNFSLSQYELRAVRQKICSDFFSASASSEKFRNCVCQTACSQWYSFIILLCHIGKAQYRVTGINPDRGSHSNRNRSNVPTPVASSST